MTNQSNVLALYGGPRAINLDRPHYVWPQVSRSLLDCLQQQAARSLSDRDAKGVIGEFERGFADFIGARHGVAFASGTSALHAMCAAAGLGEGDEILCCAYGFFASVSPFAYEGVNVVFCDADAQGNLSIHSLTEKLTPRTRAVMAVHIWGNPCDMDAISAFCVKNRLILLEDCSHAHFASWAGRRVGRFGAMAAFSLNQKVITAGEGGILVTDDDRLRDLAVLFGHYNVRARSEIAVDRSFAPYAFTGMGLKHRPHTLAMALALHELERRDDIEDRRRRNLAILAAAARRHGVLHPVIVDPDMGHHGLYVLAFRVVSESQDARNRIHRALLAEGGEEFDVPSSTKLMQREPLFLRNSRNVGWDHPDGGGPSNMDTEFPGAMKFRDSIIKVPLWGYKGDVAIVEAYARAIKKVSSAVVDGSLSLN